MTDLPPNAADTRMAFDLGYWNAEQALQRPAADERRSLKARELSTSSMILSTRELTLAWRAIVANQLVVDPVPEGESFKPFGRDSSSYHHSSGSVLLVDLEKIGKAYGKIIPTIQDGELFAATAQDFIRTVNPLSQRPRRFQAELRIRNPYEPTEMYQRVVRTIVMIGLNDGTSCPMEPRGVIGIGNERGLRANLANLASLEGLSIVGQSYITTDKDGSPDEVSRIRSLSVINGSSMRPPKAEKQAGRIGAFLGGLNPTPNLSPGF